MLEQNRINAYHIMWVMTFFDLPVVTKKQRKRAAAFRKFLEKDGFTMMQYSVYIRHCASKESGEVHIKRVRSNVPQEGQVSILTITDKQYSNIINIWGAASRAMPEGPKQLEIF